VSAEPEQVSETVTWEKAIAQNGFGRAFLDDLPDLHLTMLRDFLHNLADQRWGEGRWLKRDESVEEYEPPTREHSYQDTDDDDNPIVDDAGRPVIVHWHDDQLYCRMSAWFRPKLEGE
jgi:hypothetical protein